MIAYLKRWMKRTPRNFPIYWIQIYGNKWEIFYLSNDPNCHFCYLMLLDPVDRRRWQRRVAPGTRHLQLAPDLHRRCRRTLEASLRWWFSWDIQNIQEDIVVYKYPCGIYSISPVHTSPKRNHGECRDLYLFETIYGVFNTRGIGLVLIHGGLQ